MFSRLAFLRFLVLPAGAINGPRIVLNGLSGRIEVYDVNGDLYGLIDPVDGFAVFDPANPTTSIALDISLGLPALTMRTGDVDEDNPGFVFGASVGAGGTRALTLGLQSPSFDPSPDVSGLTQLLLVSESQDGTVPADIATVFDGNPISLGRGVVPNKSFVSAITDPGSPYVADADSDMVITNVPVIAGRTYEVWLHCPYLFASIAATATWAVNLKVNGVVLDRFATLEPGVTGNLNGVIHSAVLWTPTVTAATDDLVVSLDEVTNGADLSLEANGTTLRRLYIKDIGQLS